MRAKEVPAWTPKFTEEEEEDDLSIEDNHGGIHSDQEINNYNDESDVEEVPETCFNVPKGNLNEGHLDGGCAKKVNEEVAGMITRLCILLVVKKTLDQLTKCQSQLVRIALRNQECH
nr:ATPase, AAA-type, core [Tanacetum cinerariifolium]